MHCKTCFQLDGVVTRAVVEAFAANEATGVRFKAFVCARCLSEGREMRVTCRTFGKQAQTEFAREES